MDGIVEISHLVVPAGFELSPEGALAIPSQDHEKVEVFNGTKAMQKYGIEVIGEGSSANGNINGTITTYDYKALYTIYNLKQTDSRHYWFVSYSKDTSHDELKKTFESSQTVPLHYNVNFTIHGNDWGQSSVFITFGVIRIKYNGETKDFVVANGADMGANNSDGSKYQGGFSAVNA